MWENIWFLAFWLTLLKMMFSRSIHLLGNWWISILLFIVVVLTYIATNRIRVPFSPNPHQYLLLFIFVMVVILTRVRWNINVLWFEFPLLAGMFSSCSCIYWPFVLIFWELSVYFIYLFVHWVIVSLGSLVFWAEAL
jgi:hypothetical protein